MINNETGYVLALLFALVFVLGGCNANSSKVSSNYEVEPEKKIAVECCLKIRRDSDSVFAVIQFKNIARKNGFVHKRVLLSAGEYGAFEITRDGGEVPYIGPFIDNAGSTIDDWQLLKEGETYETEVPISDYYDFSCPGEYQIAYRRAYRPGGKLTILQSNTVKLVVPR